MNPFARRQLRIVSVLLAGSLILGLAAPGLGGTTIKLEPPDGKDVAEPTPLTFGVVFRPGVEVGVGVSTQMLLADYDALVLPGGVISPDSLRIDPKAVNFVRQFVSSGKTVAAICHGPWTLLEAGVLSGKKVTSWLSLKTDLKNAGATWVDQEVVTDGQFITSRNQNDIPAFNRAIIDSVSRGVHQHAAV